MRRTPNVNTERVAREKAMVLFSLRAGESRPIQQAPPAGADGAVLRILARAGGYFLRRRAQRPARASRESVPVAGSGTAGEPPLTPVVSTSASSTIL